MFRIVLQQYCKKICNTAVYNFLMQEFWGFKMPNFPQILFKMPNFHQIWHQHSPMLMLLEDFRLLSSSHLTNKKKQIESPSGSQVFIVFWFRKYADVDRKLDPSTPCLAPPPAPFEQFPFPISQIKELERHAKYTDVMCGKRFLFFFFFLK